jgi:hypothetical protein
MELSSTFLCKDRLLIEEAAEEEEEEEEVRAVGFQQSQTTHTKSKRSIPTVALT